MAKTKTLDDAKLLVEAGKAISGIHTFLMPCPSTQPEDLIEDAEEAILNSYQKSTIRRYVNALRNHGLEHEAKDLCNNYHQLRKIAHLKPVKI